jgi:hypothetical protein
LEFKKEDPNKDKSIYEKMALKGLYDAFLSKTPHVYLSKMNFRLKICDFLCSGFSYDELALPKMFFMVRLKAFKLMVSPFQRDGIFRFLNIYRRTQFVASANGIFV